jgi:hypothetical protein
MADPKRPVPGSAVPVLAAALLAVALIAVAPPASAATSFDYLFNMSSVTDDNQMFLNLTVRKYGYEPADLDPVLPRLRSVELDLPVVLFLSRKSGESIETIAGIRSRGFAWSVIFQKVGVPIGVVFSGIESDPGPPYGKAWGHWKKNPRSARLADPDIAGLVQIQIGSRWARLTPYELARARGQGKKVTVLVAEKKGRPYRAAKTEHASTHGKGKGKPKAHGPKH